MRLGILGGGNPYALNLANHCKENGIDVFGIGRSPPRAPPMWPVFREYRYYQGHLVTQLEAIMGILGTERPDFIVNFAAQGEGQGSFGEDAHLFFQTNTVALVKLVESLRKVSWLKKFVQIGTSELYGSVSTPSKETDAIKPTSPYAISKAAFDLHLEVMTRVHGFNATVVRPSNAFCRGQQLHRVIPKSIIYALSGKLFPLQGSGRAKKSYLHASDLSLAILLLLNSEPGIYNAGPAMPTSIRDVVEMCANACGRRFGDVAHIVEDRVGQDGQYWLDSSKLESFGWFPRIGLMEGISDMANWVESNPVLLSMSTEWRVTP